MINKENIVKNCFLFGALCSIGSLIIICIFLFSNGIPTIQEIGFFNFVFGDTWAPSRDIYGIFPMIIGSVCTTLGAMAIGVPLGIFTAIYLAYFSKSKLRDIVRSGVDLLAGIPSIVYGFFGIMVIVPLIRTEFGGSGYSLAAASIILGIIILPIIINISESSLLSLDKEYYLGARALGATKEEAVFFVMLPAAKSGIFSSIILGLGRAIGETMAVVMVAGNQAILPRSLFLGVRTLTSNIVLEMGYAADLHRDSLIATAVILFIFILLINLCLTLVKQRGIQKRGGA